MLVSTFYSTWLENLSWRRVKKPGTHGIQRRRLMTLSEPVLINRARIQLSCNNDPMA